MTQFRNKLVWNGDKFYKAFQDDQVKRMTRAAIYLTREIKQNISIAAKKVKVPPAFASGEGNNARSTLTGRFVKKVTIKQRSKPGEFPRKDFGELRRSITYEIVKTANNVLARVGTNKIYGRYLEFGTRSMAKRPWLRPSLAKARASIVRVIKGKLHR